MPYPSQKDAIRINLGWVHKSQHRFMLKVAKRAFDLNRLPVSKIYKRPSLTEATVLAFEVLDKELKK